ncbi:MAG: dUTP diphosphatase [Bifidobacteriaceae bacterium]|jgi:dUTP pyrophosphatase|nr:dUTP diphosphatase [Bifidobacteriaceae bacterium]MCI1978810.1 dUTP diphosphatase [Bifidobacteriaceae bacterium]
MAYDEAYNEPENSEVLISGIDGSAPSFIPTYEHAGDAGADLRAAVDFSLAPFERMLVPTGITIALPNGYAAFVYPRSGLAIKRGVSLANAVGLIDSGYRGEIKVPLVNLDPHNTWHFKSGERIAQLVIQRYVAARFIEATTLPGSDRGARGFGSTGLGDSAAASTQSVA